MSEVPRAVLDSDVIFSRVLHELMGRVASDALLLDLIWSNELLDEARNSLINRKNVPEHAAQRWVDHMRREFPEGEVDITTVPADVDLSKLAKDPGDEHVCALAIAGEADYLFTFDRDYLRGALSEHGIRVCAPDVFLSEQIDENPEALLEALELQIQAWGGGQRSLADLVDAIERARAVVFARKVRVLLGL